MKHKIRVHYQKTIIADNEEQAAEKFWAYIEKKYEHLDRFYEKIFKMKKVKQHCI